MKVLVISDTHNILPIDIERVDHDALIHAGDIGNDKFMNNFYGSDPFFAVAGNTDYISTVSLPETLCEKVNGITFFLVHNLSAPHRIISSNFQKICKTSPDIVIFGHTHMPMIEKKNGIVFLNPGSLGKTGLTGYRSYAVLETKEDAISEIKIFSAETGEVIQQWRNDQ